MVEVKYKAEVALEHYKSSVQYYNEMVEWASIEYKPNLQKIQILEDRRINFIKFILERLVKLIHSTNISSNDVQKMNDAVSLLNSGTDI